MKNKQILSTVILISTFIISGCGVETATVSTTNPPTSSTTNTEKPASGGMKMTPVTPSELTPEQVTQLKTAEADHQPTTLTFTVDSGNFYYTPNQIKVKKGDTVKIIFQNSGGMHNFNLDEFGAKTKTIKTGESDTIQFVADKVGNFKYYCSIGSHRQMGQEGNFIVE